MAYPPRVMVTTISSSAIRSSIETSPSNGRISRATLVAVLGDDLAELGADDLALPGRAGQDRLEVGDLDHQLVVVVDDLLALQGREAAQLHVEDRVGLQLVDLEQLDQAGAGLVGVRRPPDQRDDLVERVQRLEVAAQDVGALLGLAQPVLGAPDDDLDLVRHPVPDERVERQGARHAVDQREHVRAEGVLQLGVLVEVVEHDLGDRVALEHDDQPLAGAAGGLVADVGDAGDLAVLDQVGDLGREVVRVHLVRQLGDHQALAALDLLDLDDGAHGDRAAPGAVGVLDAAPAQDRGAGGEVRARDALDAAPRAAPPCAASGWSRCHWTPVVDLAQVVRRDVRGHADGDPGAAVDQQVGEPGRQDGRLLGAAVVVVAEVDGLLVDVADHLHGQRRQLALGVPHARRPGRCPGSRSCPARRPAGSAATRPAPAGPGRRRSRESPCGWYLPITSPTTRAHLE